MENLQSKVAVGMDVVTREGDAFGKVKEVGSGTFEIQHGVWMDHQYAVPYTAIASAEKGKLVLSLGHDELKALRKSGHIGTTIGERAEGVVEHAKEAIEEVADAVRTHPVK